MMDMKYTVVILMVLALNWCLPVSSTSGEREEKSPVKNLEILEDASISPERFESQNATKELDATQELNATQKKGLMTVIAIMLILCISFLICYSKCWTKLYRLCQRRGTPRDTIEVRRKFDCFLVASSRDYELLRRSVIFPLTQRGYSIAWHENVFRPGDWIIANVEKAVRNSSRMLVFASDNFVQSRWGRQEIRRGLHEEFAHQDFRVMGLVTETLSRELNADLFKIIALRTHVLLSDRDYIQQICNFLPPPAPNENQPDGVYRTEDDINTYYQRVEEKRQRERRLYSPSAELFHTRHEQNHVTINVDIATASTSHIRHKSDVGSMSEEERSKIVERFKAIPTAPLPTSRDDTTSLNDYILITEDNDEDMADMLQDDNFKRFTYKRITCKI